MNGELNGDVIHSSANENTVAHDVIMALEEEGFASIIEDWNKWGKRTDLFDEVVTRNVEFIIGFIQQVEDAKEHTLAALFLKRLELVDEVLKKIITVGKS